MRAIILLLFITFPLLSLALDNDTGEPGEREIEIEVGEVHPAREMLDLGTRYYNTRQFEQAIATYEKVLSDFPGSEYSSEAQFKIANVYHWGIRDPQKAIENYQIARDRYPGSKFAVESLARIGSIYHWELETPDPRTAIGYYERMLSEAPDSEYAPETLFWIGEAYRWMLKDTDKAMEVYQSVVDRYPDSNYAIKAQLRIAYIYWEKQWGDLRAKEIYERIVSEYSEGPEVEEARYYLGEFYLRKGDHESALKEFTSALNYSTDHIECLYWTGHRIANIYGCYGCLPSSDGNSQRIFEQILKNYREMFPISCHRIMTEEVGTRNAILAQYYLGKFYFDNNDCDKAIEMFTKVISAIPKYDRLFYEAQFYRAWCYAIKGQYEDSVGEYQNMLKYTDNKPAVLLNIATTYEEANDFANAKIYYIKVAESYPGTQYADEAIKKLKIMELLKY